MRKDDYTDGTRGNPLGDVSRGLEGMGSGALVKGFISERSIVVSSIEVERSQSVWAQGQVGKYAGGTWGHASDCFYFLSEIGIKFNN